MEDKKQRELTEKQPAEIADEALDAAAGGSKCIRNAETGLYDVYTNRKQFLDSFTTEEDAQKFMEMFSHTPYDWPTK